MTLALERAVEEALSRRPSVDPFTYAQGEDPTQNTAETIDPEDLRDELRSLSLPSSFGLATLRSARLRLAEEIHVEHRIEDDLHVMEATELNEFGFAGNFCDALVDLQASIVELYSTLEAEQRQLGPDLASVWAILSSKIRVVDASHSA